MVAIQAVATLVDMAVDGNREVVAIQVAAAAAGAMAGIKF